MKEIKSIQDCLIARLPNDRMFWKFFDNAYYTRLRYVKSIASVDDLNAAIENMIEQYVNCTGFTCRYNHINNKLVFIVENDKYVVSLSKLYKIVHGD